MSWRQHLNAWLYCFPGDIASYHYREFSRMYDEYVAKGRP